MLKILIVDDEKTTRDVIVRFMPWKELGITRIIEAEDGVQAFNEAIASKPDILLTDIKMPKMNGVELAEKVRNILPDCKIIFLTGYSDIEYLKAAIRYKAVSYVEKPVELDELGNELKAAAAECITDLDYKCRQQKEEIARLCIKLSNTGMDIDDVSARIQALDIRFGKSNLYLTAVLEFYAADIDSSHSHNLNYEDCLLKLNSTLDKYSIIYIAGFEDREHLIIHFSPEDCETDTIIKSLQEFIDELHKRDPFYHQITAAVGTVEKGLKGIAVSYKNAKSALQRKFFDGLKNVLQFRIDSSPSFVLDETWLKQFSEALPRNKINEAVIIIKRLANELRNYRNTQPDYIRNIFIRLIMILSMYVKEYNIPLLYDECSFVLESISSAASLNEIENETISLINSVFSSIEKNQNTGDAVNKIVEYIHKNYSNPGLSVNVISQEIFLTVSYLCVIFKKNTGKTINQYITEYRIGKAKELLKNPCVKVQDVAERVGYTDSKYFARVFEKSSGFKPKKYRELQHEA